MTTQDLSDIWRAIRAIESTLSDLKTPDVLYRDSGTYTPTYIGGTTAGVTTYTAQLGAWRQFADELSVIGQVAWSAATGTGEARISLPFAPSGYNAPGSLWISNVTFANSTPLILASAGNTYFTLDSPLTNNANTRVNVEAAGNIVFVLTYLV